MNNKMNFLQPPSSWLIHIDQAHYPYNQRRKKKSDSQPQPQPQPQPLVKMLKFKRRRRNQLTSDQSGQRSSASSSYSPSFGSSGMVVYTMMIYIVITATLLMDGLGVGALVSENPGALLQALPKQQPEPGSTNHEQRSSGSGSGPGSVSGSSGSGSPNIKSSNLMNISFKMNDDFLMDLEYDGDDDHDQPDPGVPYKLAHHQHHYLPTTNVGHHPSSSGSASASASLTSQNNNNNNNNNPHHYHYQNPKPFINSNNNNNNNPYSRSSFKKSGRIKSAFNNNNNFHSINSTKNANVNNGGSGQNIVIGELNNIGPYWLHPPPAMTMIQRSSSNRRIRSRRLTHAYNTNYNNNNEEEEEAEYRGQNSDKPPPSPASAPPSSSSSASVSSSATASASAASASASALSSSSYQSLQHQPRALPLKQYSYAMKAKPLKLLSLYSPSSSSSLSSSSSTSFLNSYFNNYHPHSASAASASAASLLSASVSSAAAASAASASAASSQAAAVSGQQNRLKILLNPPPAGFGGGLIPNKKCNFEIYPSGCFDENGSICGEDGLCQCRPGYTIRIASLYCLRPSFIGEACYTTEQCEHKVINSGCFNYREEYREVNPSAFFGPSQSSWPMGECRCRIGHRFDDRSNACVRSIIGSWCSNVWDCEMADEEQHQQQHQQHIDMFGGGGGGHRSNRTGTHHFATPNSNANAHNANNANLHGQQHVNSPPMHLASTSRNKIANLVCEKNTCNCSQYFYYNQTAEECQYFETYGQLCEGLDGPAHLAGSTSGNAPQPSSSSSSSSIVYNPSKRSVRFRNRRNRLAKSILAEMAETLNPSSSASSYRESGGGGGEFESLSSLTSLQLSSSSVAGNPRFQDSICNYPTVCTVNKTCGCAEGYEHQPQMVPQCQRIGGGGGAHYTHYFHSGSSIRSGIKGQDYPHDRSSMYHEGTSNVANFFEYVLYFLVPGLIIIFIFKPCFRRIGEWRNHMHQYQSDSDFYLATTANGRPVLAEMSVIGPQCTVDKTGAANQTVAGGGAGASGTATTILSSSASSVTNPGGHAHLHHPPPPIASAASATIPTVGDVYSNEFASYAAFAPHLVYHNAYLFDTTDPCYATPIGYGCHPPLVTPAMAGASMIGGPGPSQPSPHHHQQQQQQSSMALVREKLQTIEESEQSEDGGSTQTTIHNNFGMNPTTCGGPSTSTTIIPTNGCSDCAQQQNNDDNNCKLPPPPPLPQSSSNLMAVGQNQDDNEPPKQQEEEAEASTIAVEIVDNQEEMGDRLATSSTATTSISPPTPPTATPNTTQVDNGDHDQDDVADST